MKERQSASRYWLPLYANALLLAACSQSDKQEARRDPPPRLAPVLAQDASPAPVDAGPSLPPPAVVQLSIGYRHTCALTEAGTVRCWGTGDNGRLGYGNTRTIGDDEPAYTGGDVNLGGPASQIATGAQHTCALMRSGAVRCFGGNQHGQLGYGHKDAIGDNEHPASAGDIRLGGEAIHIEAGGSMSCAVLDGGQVRCWGYGREGGLGEGQFPGRSIGDDEHPADVAPLDIGADAIQVALDRSAGCALLKSATVRCWGHQPGRQGGVQKKPSAVPDIGLGAPVERLSASFGHTCALLKGGGVRCWGERAKAVFGQPGRDFIGVDQDWRELGDIKVGGKVIDVSVGSGHVCTLIDDGSVRCWGKNHLGQLGRSDKVMIGDDENPASTTPVDIGGPVRHIAAGGSVSCALLKSGAVRCWGLGKHGQLGYGSTATIGDDESPASAGDVPIFAPRS